MTACVLSPWKYNELVEVPLAALPSTGSNPTSATVSGGSSEAVQSTAAESQQVEDKYCQKVSTLIEVLFDLNFQQM